jgi:uncharacterized membrane protein
MPNVTVWLFDSPGGAAGALTLLQTLAVEGVLEIVDCAVVEWSDERPEPTTTPFKRPGLRQLTDARSGRLLGALRPGRSIEVEGLDREFVDQFHSKVTPGTSVLCLVAENTDRGRLVESMGSGLLRPTLVQTNLSEQEEAAMRALLDGIER